MRGRAVLQVLALFGAASTFAVMTVEDSWRTTTAALTTTVVRDTGDTDVGQSFSCFGTHSAHLTFNSTVTTPFTAALHGIMSVEERQEPQPTSSNSKNCGYWGSAAPTSPELYGATLTSEGKSYPDAPAAWCLYPGDNSGGQGYSAPFEPQRLTVLTRLDAGWVYKFNRTACSCEQLDDVVPDSDYYHMFGLAAADLEWFNSSVQGRIVKGSNGDDRKTASPVSTFLPGPGCRSPSSSPLPPSNRSQCTFKYAADYTESGAGAGVNGWCHRCKLANPPPQCKNATTAFTASGSIHMDWPETTTGLPTTVRAVFNSSSKISQSLYYTCNTSPFISNLMLDRQYSNVQQKPGVAWATYSPPTQCACGAGRRACAEGCADACDVISGRCNCKKHFLGPTCATRDVM